MGRPSPLGERRTGVEQAVRNVRVIWSTFSRATCACTRCGAKDVSPDPGPLGTVGDLFGLARYLCSDCRHRFWMRAGSRPHGDRPVPSVEEAGWPAPEPGVPTASLAVLDVEPASLPAGPPDLSVLDADLARLRDRPSKKGRRRRRAELDETPATRP
jgi:hypothetical protein